MERYGWLERCGWLECFGWLGCHCMSTALEGLYWKALIQGEIFFNRPGVARAVIVSLINSVTDPLWKYLQKTFTPKP